MSYFSIDKLEDELAKALARKAQSLASLESQEMEQNPKDEYRARIKGEIAVLTDFMTELYNRQIQNRLGVETYCEESARHFGFDLNLGAIQVKKMGEEENYRYGQFQGYCVVLGILKSFY